MPQTLATRKRAEEFEKELINQGRSYLNWVFKNRYYPDGILPASFQTRNLLIGESKLLVSSNSWRMPLKISPPADNLTSSYFGIYHPDALHDFFYELKQLTLNDVLAQSERITSYSLPLPTRDGDQDKIRGISDYLRFETDISSDSYNFAILIKLDVKHCYPSIYSHSIHWAIDDYANVRNENPLTLAVTLMRNETIGSIIDKQIQGMHGGITKGLTVGPGASDIIFEVLFRKIDREISEAFTSEGIDAYGGRYKDDYRILVKDLAKKQEVISIVEKILKKYLLHLNSEKTDSGPPFDLLQREWMVEYHSTISRERQEKNQKQFLWNLAFVADLQKRYPNKRLLAKYLSNTTYKPKNIEDLHQIVSVLLALSDCFRSAVPYAISYIEKTAEGFRNECHKISEYILKKLSNESSDYNAIWYLHYLTNYLDNYQDRIEQEVVQRFLSDPFWCSLYYQDDRVFSARNLVGEFFVSTIGDKIYKQTQKYAEMY